MKVFADYHTHTVYSHGLGTIEDNVKVAIEKGLEIIAISDHGPGHIGYGIKRKKYKEMRVEIDRLRKLYPQIEILLGLEANILGQSGKIDFDQRLAAHNDILLCGYHFGSLPHRPWDVRIHVMNLLKNKSEYIFNQVKKMNTQSVVNALRKYDIKILTHPGSKGPIDLVEVAKVAYQEGTYLEISSHHSKLSVEDLISLKDFDVEFVISSDAHESHHVGRFDKGLKKIQASGIDISRVKNIRV